MTSESGRSPANGCSRAGSEIGDFVFDALTLAVSADPKAAGLDAKTFVGGAVVTQEYADSIGADFYAKDAMQSVRIAERVLKKV